MRKKLQVISILGILFLQLFTGAFVAYAGVVKYPPLSAGDKYDYSETPWYKWNQSQEPWADHRLGNSSNTIMNSGCWVVSVAMLAAMSGVKEVSNGKPITPATFNDSLVDNGMNSDLFLPSAVSGATKNKLRLVGQGSGGFDGVVNLVKEGKYVMLFSNSWGHAVAVYRVEGDKIWILDPESGQFTGGEPTMEYILKSGKVMNDKGTDIAHMDFGQIWVYESDTPSDKSLTIDSSWSSAKSDGGTTNGSTTSSIETVGQQTSGRYVGGLGSAWTPNEDDVPNMVKDRDYSEVRLEGNTEEYTRNLRAKLNELFGEKFEEGSPEALSVAKWKEERYDNYEDSAVTWTRRIIAVLGILLAVLSGVFLIIYIFDRWNLFGFSILEKLTRGKLLITDGKNKYDKNLTKKARVLTDVNVFGVIAFLSFVSVILLSGAFYWFLGILTDWISTW